MSLKTSVLWGLLAVCSLGLVMGCDKPSTTPVKGNPAMTPPADGPVANTTDSK